MIPIPALLGTLWGNHKVAIYVGVFALWTAVSFYQGYSWSRSAYDRALDKAIVQERADSAKALRKAVAAQAVINNAERTNEKLIGELDSLNSRSVCIPTTDELRILQAISDTTKHQ